jgi:S-formylglutathione hydrolase FrmB
MAVCTMSFWGEALQKECSMNLILPDRLPTRKRLSVLYQLHGLSDDHTGWLRRTSIDRYVSGLPLIVVMPDGGRSFYCDAVEGPAYEKHVLKDVIGFVERFFPVRAERSGRAVGGLSMGGYGAMKLALKFPHVFASVVSHSSAFDFAHDPKTLDDAEFRRIVGDKLPGGKDDLYAIAERLSPRHAPAIRIDCGKNDALLEGNRRFHRHLLRLHIRHQYREFPGEHNWAYWDERVQEAIRFHAQHLKV